MITGMSRRVWRLNGRVELWYSVLMKPLSLIATTLTLLLWTGHASASTAADFAVASYLPWVALGALLFVGGLALAKVLTSWWELDAVGKARRVVGVGIAAIGMFALVFGAIEAPPLKGEGLPWHHLYTDGLTDSAQTQRAMMVDFTADWCGACKELEAEVFHHDDVRDRLGSDYVLVKIDVDEDVPANQKAFGQFGFGGLPAVAFVGPDGREIQGASFEGKVDVATFTATLDAVDSGELGGAGRDEIRRVLEDQGLLAALFVVFLAGVLSSLTPCVYPLIPITVGIFGARQADTRTRAFGLSLVYVLGIAVTYSILGVAAASLGTVFGGAMQNPWVLSGIAVLFVALGLSSLGVFDFRLPGALHTKLSQAGGVGAVGAFLMGLVAGIIAAPCVGPIVAGILLYVAQQQDIFLGWLLLMVFAVGMGQLFLVLGTFSSLLNRLPKSGAWMEAVKTVFGVIFLAMAVYYLQFLIPDIAHVARSVWLAIG